MNWIVGASTQADARPLQLFSTEFWFIVAALFFFTQPIAWLFDEDTILNQGAIEFLTRDQVVFITAGLIMVVMAYFSRHHLLQLRDVTLASWVIWLIIGVAFLSVLWSIDPALTVRRSLTISLSTAFAIYLGVRATPYQLLIAVSMALGVGVMLSILMLVIAPEFAIMTGSPPVSYAWRGVYPHKGVLSRVAGLGVVVFWLLAVVSNQHRRAAGLAWIGVAVSLFVLTMTSTRSTSGVMGLTVGIAYLLQVRGWWFGKYGVSTGWREVVFNGAALGLIGFTVILGIAVQPERYISSLFLDERRIINGVWYDISEPLWNTELESEGGLIQEEALETDVTFTGRTDLWRALWNLGQERPVLGYGYGAFWDGDEARNHNALPEESQWAFSAHNGMFDVFLALGIVGVLVLSIEGAWLGSRLVRDYAFNISHPVFMGYIAFLIYWAGINVLDSNLMNSNNIFWILPIAIIAQNTFWKPHQDADVSDSTVS